MDNLSSHKGPRERDDRGGRREPDLSAPYPPDFNSIETAFARLKALLYKAAGRTIDGPWAAIGHLIERFETRRMPKLLRRPEPGHSSRIVVEQGALSSGRAGGDALESVPQRSIADAHLVDGKIALEHGAMRAEQIDAGLDIGAPHRRRIGRGRRRGNDVVVVGGEPHLHPAELDRNVWSCGHLGARGSPGLEDDFRLKTRIEARTFEAAVRVAEVGLGVSPRSLRRAARSASRPSKTI